MTSMSGGDDDRFYTVTPGEAVRIRPTSGSTDNPSRPIDWHWVPPAPLFQAGSKGLIRFPENVELIRLDTIDGTVWLTARRNQTALSFPLDPRACRALAQLLTAAADLGPQAVEPPP